MTDIQLTGFEMMHKLGEGGMASVWQARQISLDRIVAIKILSSRFASDSDDIQRFQQEAQSAAKLKHPGIVQVYDANIENGVYFIVMEFVDGYTCADWLMRKGSLDEKDVLLIAECVADALGYAWERQSIIHCDIKPDNVMVDEDGTVKVTDLGLSRTINAMNVDEETEEILGTPAYMAPEQAMGEAGQDCRVDMYALGAMMYHLSTGKLLFEDSPQEEVMERQVNDTVVNPRELNPSLSRGFCRLVEVLMAKEKEGRPDDWETVREALKRVKKGHMPKLSLPEGMQSTVLKSASDEAAAHSVHGGSAASVSAAGAGAEAKKTPIALILGGALALAVIAFVAFRIMSPSGTRPAAVGGMAPTPPSEVSRVEQKGRTLYAAASRWETDHPASYEQSISRYERVRREAPGTKYVAQATQAIARLEEAQKKDAQISAVAALNRSADSFLRQNLFDKAIEVYANYTGVGASETRSVRDAKISQIREKQKVWLEAEKRRVWAEKEAKYIALLDKVVDLVLKDDFRNAKNAVETVVIAGGLTGREDDLRNLAAALADAADMDKTILESFQKQVGTKVTVRLASGTKTLVIEQVKDDEVIGGETLRVGSAMASVTRNFKLADLAVAERLGRMGRDDEPAVALVKGVMAYRSQSMDHARRYFAAAPHSIAEKLIAKLDSASVSSGPSTAVVTDVPPVVADVPQPAANPLQPDMPAAQADDVDAFMNKFIADNPGMDSEQVRLRRGNSGEVIAATVRSPELRDLSAFASLRNLREFEYVGHWRDVAPVSDLTPLARLPLVSVVMINTAVDSVEPIRGMNLKRLALTGCPLKDISPLASMRLESLDLSRTRVFDFSHIKRMPLKEFSANGTQIKNVSFFRGMDLESVSLADTPVFDFSVFSRMPLRELNVSKTQFKYLDQVKNCPLKILRANDSKLTDLTALKYFAKTLEILELDSIGARRFDSLKELNLSHLSLAHTQFEDSALLGNMTLSSLNLKGSKVNSIDAVTCSKMEELNIEKTGIGSIAKLRGAPLERFYCEGAPIHNFTPIYGAPIERMTVSHPATKWSLYSELPELESVNGQDIHDDPVWD